MGGYENVQYLWLSLKKEKESQEKNNQKESQEEKEITCPCKS
jgi:hypothetical protein